MTLEECGKGKIWSRVLECLSFPPVLGYSTFHTSSIITALLLQYMVIQASLYHRVPYSTAMYFKMPSTLIHLTLHWKVFNGICLHYYLFHQTKQWILCSLMVLHHLTFLPMRWWGWYIIYNWRYWGSLGKEDETLTTICCMKLKDI